MVTTELNNLKNQINVLLSDVFGLEHEIDSFHSYDDMNLKTNIKGINTELETFIKEMNSNTNGVIAMIAEINNTSSMINLQNLSNIKVSTMNGDNQETSILLSP
jgi:hypothetical protein